LSKITNYHYIFNDKLDGFTKASQNAIKKMTSKQYIKFRPPYGRTDQYYNRKATFIAATNEEAIFRDLTSSRRYLILDIEKLTINTANINFNNVWNYVYNLYCSGMTHKDVEYDFSVNEANREISLEEKIFLDKLVPTEFQSEVFMYYSDIIEVLPERSRGKSGKFIGNVLKKIGIQNEKRTIDNKSRTVYYCKHIVNKYVENANRISLHNLELYN